MCVISKIDYFSNNLKNLYLISSTFYNHHQPAQLNIPVLIIHFQFIFNFCSILIGIMSLW